MQHHRTYLLAYEQRRLVEAAILALLLAEDWSWRAGELARRLRLPADVIGLSTATLSADGLIVSAGADRLGSGDRLSESWAAGRCDELLRQGPAISPPTRTNVESTCRRAEPR
jgi:hypothetical protein